MPHGLWLHVCRCSLALPGPDRILKQTHLIAGMQTVDHKLKKRQVRFLQRKERYTLTRSHYGADRRTSFPLGRAGSS